MKKRIKAFAVSVVNRDAVKRENSALTLHRCDYDIVESVIDQSGFVFKRAFCSFLSNEENLWNIEEMTLLIFILFLIFYILHPKCHDGWNKNMKPSVIQCLHKLISPDSEFCHESWNLFLQPIRYRILGRAHTREFHS